MATYKVVDLDSFPRSDYYHYFMATDTTFEMTVKIDVTRAVEKCKAESISFYAYSIYCLTESVNKIRNLRYGHVDKQLVEWQELVPTFTNFNQRTEMFYSLWLEELLDYQSVDREYKQLIQEYGNTSDIAPMGNMPPNIVNISSIPWAHFEHFSSQATANKNNVTPMITSGKYEKVGSQLLMPVNIKVHHATVDGYHVSLFFKTLQSEMNR